jgi:hypothetical protein
VLQAEVSWIAVLVAGLAAVVVGWLWYAPFLFGNLWMRLLGKTKEQVEKDFHPLKIVWAFLLSCAAASFLATFMSWLTTGGALRGAYLGFYAALGFSATTFAVNDVFEGRPFTLWLVNACYHVVVLVVMGAIVGAMR